MPDLWRLFRAKHGPGLDGTGGTFAEGRWHSRGELVVYFGSSAAIVVLERLAHIDADLLPDDLRLGLFRLPNGSGVPLTIMADSLPDGWIQDQGQTRGIGGDWLSASSSCLLAVPSAILPEETNYLFNPRHPVAAAIRLVRERPFSFDHRLI